MKRFGPGTVTTVDSEYVPVSGEKMDWRIIWLCFSYF
jgi:hypothetical protein